MALNLNVKGTGPGQAALEVGGAQIPSRGLEIAIKRTDDNYVGPGAKWQPMIEWHRLEPSGEATGAAAGAGSRFLLGQDIVDALAEVARADSFWAQLRWNGGTGEGTLAVKGELFASAARIPAAMPPAAEGAGFLVRTDGQAASAVVLPDPEAPPSTPDSIWRKPKIRRWMLGLLAMLLLLALVGWFSHKWSTNQPSPPPVDPSVSGPGPTTGPGPVTGADSPNEHTPDLILDPEPIPGVDPGLRGSEYVRALADKTKDPAIYMKQAEGRAKLDDCSALRLLYDLAAKADPRIAADVARHYDPEGFARSRCITNPSEANAMEYYALAAEGGDAGAKRRLGQMLIEDRGYGPEYDAGLRWLRDAESAGDAEAKRILDTLKYRSFENRQ